MRVGLLVFSYIYMSTHHLTHSLSHTYEPHQHTPCFTFRVGLEEVCGGGGGWCVGWGVGWGVGERAARVRIGVGVRSVGAAVAFGD